jgi:hypothetical protein
VLSTSQTAVAFGIRGSAMITSLSD